jgi:outer membrane protein assembly factor BamE (lipoprotein component of BamABCDE complex)
MANRRVAAIGFMVCLFVAVCGASDPNQVSQPVSTEPAAAETTIQPWMVWNFWQMLQPGMSKDKVVELFGDPLEKESTETACVWYYQQAPQHLASGVVQRPRTGFLNFRKTLSGGQELMLLKTWKEPDWNQVGGYSLEQFQAQQKKIDLLRQQELRLQQQAEELKRREEETRRQQELLQQQKIEQEQQIRAQQEAQKSKGFSLDWKNWPRSYWYAGGGILIGLAIAVIFIKKPFMN